MAEGLLVEPLGDVVPRQRGLALQGGGATGDGVGRLDETPIGRAQAPQHRSVGGEGEVRPHVAHLSPEVVLHEKVIGAYPGQTQGSLTREAQGIVEVEEGVVVLRRGVLRDRKGGPEPRTANESGGRGTSGGSSPPPGRLVISNPSFASFLSDSNGAT